MELRKRSRQGQASAAQSGHTETSLPRLLELVGGCTNLVVFTGSGLSANSGMSMFTSRNGLYDRARKKFKIQDGIKLFTYSFFKARRAEVQAFFAQIYSEAQASRAAPGHHALAEIAELGHIKRHYTLNIDGLSEVVGMSTWHHELQPHGSTVEMHGNIRQLVCPSCHAVEPLTRTHITAMKELSAIPCRFCQEDNLRFKVMLYGDDEGDCITPEHVFETMEEDLEVADCVLWIGISFEQSASVEYFRRVRQALASLGRLDACVQAIINPADEAFFNVVSSVCNVDDLKLLDVRATADEALPALAECMRLNFGKPAPGPPPPAAGPGPGPGHPSTHPNTHPAAAVEDTTPADGSAPFAAELDPADRLEAGAGGGPSRGAHGKILASISESLSSMAAGLLPPSNPPLPAGLAGAALQLPLPHLPGMLDGLQGPPSSSAAAAEEASQQLGRRAVRGKSLQALVNSRRSRSLDPFVYEHELGDELDADDEEMGVGQPALAVPGLSQAQLLSLLAPVGLAHQGQTPAVAGPQQQQLDDFVSSLSAAAMTGILGGGAGPPMVAPALGDGGAGSWLLGGLQAGSNAALPALWGLAGLGLPVGPALPGSQAMPPPGQPAMGPIWAGLLQGGLDLGGAGQTAAATTVSGPVALQPGGMPAGTMAAELEQLQQLLQQAPASSHSQQPASQLARPLPAPGLGSLRMPDAPPCAPQIPQPEGAARSVQQDHDIEVKAEECKPGVKHEAQRQTPQDVQRQADVKHEVKTEPGGIAGSRPGLDTGDMDVGGAARAAALAMQTEVAAPVPTPC